MTMKAVKKMTIGRSAEGSFGFEVDGEVVRAIFKNNGKAHNITLEMSKSDLLAEIANLTAAPTPTVEIMTESAAEPEIVIDVQPEADAARPEVA